MVYSTGALIVKGLPRALKKFGFVGVENLAVLKILEKKFKGSRGHLGKLSFGGGKFGSN